MSDIGTTNRPQDYSEQFWYKCVGCDTLIVVGYAGCHDCDQWELFCCGFPMEPVEKCKTHEMDGCPVGPAPCNIEVV